MKSVLIIILVAMTVALLSCSVGKGCPSSGRSVGAEKILSGDPKALKEIKKARKFKA